MMKTVQTYKPRNAYEARKAAALEQRQHYQREANKRRMLQVLQRKERLLQSFEQTFLDCYGRKPKVQFLHNGQFRINSTTMTESQLEMWTRTMQAKLHEQELEYNAEQVD